jgi:hypothetical protein
MAAESGEYRTKGSVVIAKSPELVVEAVSKLKSISQERKNEDSFIGALEEKDTLESF